MSSLWPSGVPKIVHKSIETGGCSSPPSRNASDNLSGQSFIYESVQRGSRSRHGHSTVSARKSRFRDQSRKVLLRSNTEYGVSRFRCEHSEILTHKLAALLALTSPKRSSDLKLLDLRFMRILPEGVEFKLPGLTKTSSEVSSVFFAKYVDCDDLCVLRCLQCYILRTSTFRPLPDPETLSQLLISYHRPHGPVKSCSIARWIKSVLDSAGIDTGIFKAHSTRSASTTKARSNGVPLDEVVKMADWSGTSTFKRFYYRPTFNDAYTRAVLSSSTQ